jgi:hypothetical protein
MNDATPSKTPKLSPQPSPQREATSVSTSVSTLQRLTARLATALGSSQGVVICPLSLPDAQWPEGLKHLNAPSREALHKLLSHRKIELIQFEDSATQKLGAGEAIIATLLGFTSPSSPVAFSCALSLPLASGAAPAPYIAIRPVSLHAGRDHVVLKRSDGSYATPAQVNDLAASIRPLFTPYGLTLHTPYKGALNGANHHARWFVTPTSALGQQFFELNTSDSQQALGRNIDAYMASGQSARRWRQLETEIQMTWFDHPVNTILRAQGLDALNSIWIDGAIISSPQRPFWLSRLYSDRPSFIELAQFWQTAGGQTGLEEPAIGTCRIIDHWQSRLYGDALTWLQSWETFLAQPIATHKDSFLLMSGETSVMLLHPAKNTFISKIKAKVGFSSDNIRPELAAALGL